MSKQDDGGVAFPHVPSIAASKREHGGMSLRDWFAGQALAGYLPTFPDGVTPSYEPEVASFCYRLADAMLAERSKE